MDEHSLPYGGHLVGHIAAADEDPCMTNEYAVRTLAGSGLLGTLALALVGSRRRRPRDVTSVERPESE